MKISEANALTALTIAIGDLLAAVDVSATGSAKNASITAEELSNWINNRLQLADPESPGGETMVQVGSGSYVSGGLNTSDNKHVFELPELHPTIPPFSDLVGDQQRGYLAVTSDPNGISDVMVSKGVTADQNFASISYAPITELTFPLIAGRKYAFRADLIFNCSTPTEAIGLMLDTTTPGDANTDVLIELQSNSVGSSVTAYRAVHAHRWNCQPRKDDCNGSDYSGQL